MNIIKLSKNKYFDMDNIAYYTYKIEKTMHDGTLVSTPVIVVDRVFEEFDVRFDHEEASNLRDYLEKHFVNAYEEKEN
jgi:hypothetical protein